MKIHTTNYTNTFITVADDCPAKFAEIPPQKLHDKTIAHIQFEMISENPYKFSSDEVVFFCHATKKAFPSNDLESEKDHFFSKGQPCLRCSPLTKRYGWGIHNDENGKVALYGMETNEYRKFAEDKNLQVVKAMRSSRK